MGFFAAIVALVIVWVGFYLQDKYQKSKEVSEIELKKLIRNSGKCQELIRKRNSEIEAGQSTITHRELKLQLKKILQDPKEKERALDKIALENQRDEEEKQWKRNCRKVGYKYEIEIFEIFDVNPELSTKDLLAKIQSKFNADLKKSEEILAIWKENGLISKCSWNKRNWEVGHVLTSEFYNIDRTDMTRQKWLDQQGKKLKPESKEYKKYIDDADLPF